MNMMRKGKVKNVSKGDILRQVALISHLFGVPAYAEQDGATLSVASLSDLLQHSHHQIYYLYVQSRESWLHMEMNNAR